MIVITGAAGFIGSTIVQMVEENDIDNIVVVDDWGADERWRNLSKRKISDFVLKDDFFNWVQQNKHNIETVIHMGATTDTKCRDINHLLKNNYGYTKKLWKFCSERKIRLIYASSAAVYGDGTRGFSDKDVHLYHYQPLNPYGYSKLIFDRWALEQSEKPAQYVGLRFFNVYGPNEAHKGDMASVVLHGYRQIKEKGSVSLFKGDGKIADGEHMRDFIYVKDVAAVVKHFLEHPNISGIFNVGTGKARSFNDLARAIFATLGKTPVVRYIDMPPELQPNYQSFTQADLTKLRREGKFKENFTSLEKGVDDYIMKYLQTGEYL